ncbi:MAG: hypothetical protein AAGG11_15395 [Pseudomonadota bacterium]
MSVSANTVIGRVRRWLVDAPARREGLDLMLKQTRQALVNALPSRGEVDLAVDTARRWLVTVSSNSNPTGDPTARIFPGEDGNWYFWSRRGHGTTSRLEGPFSDLDSALRTLDRQVRDSNMRHTGLRWPRAWSPMRLRRRLSINPLPE